MNSQQARDKAINLVNEEAKEFTVELLVNQLAIENCNAQHKILFQLNSSSSMNFAAYDCRQNKGKSNKSKCTSGKNMGQNNSGAQTSSNHNQPSRKPPGMEGKCMRCGKPEHKPGQECAAKNAKCKECHKIGHFYIRYVNPRKEAVEYILSRQHLRLKRTLTSMITGETSRVSNQCRP